jgi:hypothetical protein
MTLVNRPSRLEMKPATAPRTKAGAGVSGKAAIVN